MLTVFANAQYYIVWKLTKLLIMWPFTRFTQWAAASKGSWVEWRGISPIGKARGTPMLRVSWLD